VNLSSAPEKAQAVRSPAAAARLYNSIEQELEHGLYDEDESAAGESALSDLESRFEGVRGRAHDVTDAPALSHSAKKNLAASSSEPALPDREGPDPETDEDRAPRPRASSSRRSSSRPNRSGSRSSSRGRRGGPSFEDVAGFSGGDITDTVLTGLRWLLVAGVVYQALQPKGAAAFSGVLGGIGKGISLIVDPVDPLAGGSKIEQGFAAAQKAVSDAAAANPNVMDTPTGVAPYVPPTFGAPQGTFDTPGGVAPYQPPPGIPVTKQPAWSLQLPTLTLPNL
jgi:hypothetical protein